MSQINCCIVCKLRMWETMTKQELMTNSTHLWNLASMQGYIFFIWHMPVYFRKSDSVMTKVATIVQPSWKYTQNLYSNHYHCLCWQYDERRYCEDDFQTLFAPCCKQCGKDILNLFKCVKHNLCNSPLSEFKIVLFIGGCTFLKGCAAGKFSDLMIGFLL